jgi:23S rRNA pseudouridine1911/1915/1917 synthase
VLPKFPGEGPRDLSRPLEQLKFLVDVRFDGQRLDVALATVLPWRSRQSIHRLIDGGYVTLVGRKASASRRVRTGETVVVDVPKEALPKPVPESDGGIHLPIVYQDQWMLGIDKPAGMAVHPAGRRLAGTLITELHRRYRRKDDPAHDVVPRLLHRIDVETSGIVVVGLCEQFHHLVARQFEERDVQKTYLAVVHGRPARSEGTIDYSIGPDRKSPVRLKLEARSDGTGISASTQYRVLRGNERYTLVELHPKTGRTHQLRVHMSAIGCPMVGDKIYGGDERIFLEQLAGPLSDESRARLVLDRQALHAHKLRFHHPMLDREMELVAPLPADMRSLIGDE